MVFFIFQDISSPEGPTSYTSKKSPGASLSSPSCHLDKLKLEGGGGGGGGLFSPAHHHPHHPLLYAGDPYGKLAGGADMYGVTPDYSRLMAAAGGGGGGGGAGSAGGDYSKLLSGGGGGHHSDYSKLLVGSGAMSGDYSKLLGGSYHPFMHPSYMASQLNMGQTQLPSIVPTTY
jgi:hypothetical protein